MSMLKLVMEGTAKVASGFASRCGESLQVSRGLHYVL